MKNLSNKILALICCTVLSVGLLASGVGIAYHNTYAAIPDNPIINNFQQIAVGSSTCIAIDDDSHLWVWGHNIYGQLVSSTDKNIPFQLPIGDEKYSQISIGGSVGPSFFAIDNNGYLWSWGNNYLYGQLGDGTTSNKISPEQITNGPEKYRQVSAGTDHTLAIDEDGHLLAWGSSYYGQLGDGRPSSSTISEYSSFIPEQIGTEKYIQIAAGSDYSLAIDEYNHIFSWGHNLSGQLGDGTYTDRNEPVQVGLDANWIAIAAGVSHSLAIKNDGTLWAWGSNNFGQIGDGTSTYRKSPVQVSIDTDWISVSAGNNYSIAIKKNGTLWAWGSNNYGQLGDGTNTNQNEPMQVGSDIDWASASASENNHSLAMKKDGTLWSWGSNNYGQLGDGTNTDKNLPEKISMSYTEYISYLQSQLDDADTTNANLQNQLVDANNSLVNLEGQVGTFIDEINTMLGLTGDAFAPDTDLSDISTYLNEYINGTNGLKTQINGLQDQIDSFIDSILGEDAHETNNLGNVITYVNDLKSQISDLQDEQDAFITAINEKLPSGYKIVTWNDIDNVSNYIDDLTEEINSCFGSVKVILGLTDSGDVLTKLGGIGGALTRFLSEAGQDAGTTFTTLSQVLGYVTEGGYVDDFGFLAATGFSSLGEATNAISGFINYVYGLDNSIGPNATFNAAEFALECYITNQQSIIDGFTGPEGSVTTFITYVNSLNDKDCEDATTFGEAKTAINNYIIGLNSTVTGLTDPNTGKIPLFINYVNGLVGIDGNKSNIPTTATDALSQASTRIDTIISGYTSKITALNKEMSDFYKGIDSTYISLGDVETYIENLITSITNLTTQRDALILQINGDDENEGLLAQIDKLKNGDGNSQHDLTLTIVQWSLIGAGALSLAVIVWYSTYMVMKRKAQ